MTAELRWREGLAIPELEQGEAHLWRASLDMPAARLDRLARFLSVDEVDRMRRMRLERDRNRFVAARGLLRSILARYARCPPACLRFVYGPHGKPALLAPAHASALQFSVSHSDEQALYAIARGQAVGVDLERVRPDFPCQEIVERYFSPVERRAWRALPDGLRHRSFFACWTRKEAYAKAVGVGLGLPFDTFDVSVAPDPPALLLHVGGEGANAGRFTIRDVSTGPDFAAALAVEDRQWRLTRWVWHE